MNGPLAIPSLSAAQRVAQRLCADADVALVYPDDARRLAVVAAVALAHRVDSTGVGYDHIANGVTITLPGIPSAVGTLLAHLPVVGGELERLSDSGGRTTIYLSPAAMADSVTLLATIMHERSHAGSIKRGGIPHCLAYLVAPELRGSSEAPCYGAGMAVRVAFGQGLAWVTAAAKASLDGYGLPEAELAHARALVDGCAASIAASGDVGGVVDELVAAMREEGL